jgi:2-polyprenyl-3-methyl-5-hydroxy-6-metoxy-1,4-benzoquinol methylase
MSTAPKLAIAVSGIALATPSVVVSLNSSSGPHIDPEVQELLQLSNVPYILGHSDAELRRLMLQAAMLKPITRRLLLETGLQPGMRVLDIGCGSGDVSLLLAEMVGPTGSVVGIDRSPAALALARERARAAGHPGMTFHEAAAENYADPAPFDLAIGRYVLMHQADPAVMIRAAASQVRRGGGVVAFHDEILL